MMENSNYNYNNNRTYWKKKTKAENCNGGSRSRSQNNNRKPSFGNGGRQQSTLSLEKKFCAVVGRVSWKKILHTQKYMFQDEKIINWKDSAVEEAFWNAKKRFWAEALGHPCDIELPDPDVFIDNIDWDSNVDPSLLLDLEKRDSDISCEADQKNSGVVVGIPVVPEQYVLSPMGWGDAEEEGPQLNNPEKHDSVNNAEKGCSNKGWEDDNYGHWGDNIANNAEKGCSNNGWEADFDNWGDRNMNNAEKGCANNGWEDNYFDHWGDKVVNNAEKGCSNYGWEADYDRWGDSNVNNAEKGCSNIGWDNNFVYVANDMVHYKEYNWEGYGTNKWWDHRSYKKSDYGGQHGFNISQYQHNGNDQSFFGDFGSNRRGNFSNIERPLIKWKPVSRQW
ncbi:uncharacterized protein LOC110707360 [Chenopodium quinoa]|uniref:uncharacterized protein LOC110707360 n=1 Tax=Chenopodium quinoa TaxID=63459 RepID=UPI000B785898|nr:uncharacterized protein LOC110707360 [Chenopodium quinoa]